MSDKPILFSAPMVLALLGGRKTQTRRIVTPQPSNPIDSIFSDGRSWWTGDSLTGKRDEILRVRYAVGDRLWVREAWRTEKFNDGMKPSLLLPGSNQVHYEADGTDEHFSNGFTVGRLRASMFMPRWASRLTLTVTDVRLQLLQDISEGDATAEGLSALTKDGKLIKYGIPDSDGLPGNDDCGWHWCDWNKDPCKAYATLWDRINGQGAWAKNPWVAAYSFSVSEANICSLTEAAA